MGVDTSTSVKGLFYGGGMAQLMSQAIGSGVGRRSPRSPSSFVLMYAVKATGTLRVSTEGELEGLDLHEHGMPAYPEFVVHGYLGTSASPSMSSVTAPQTVAKPVRA